MKICGSNEGQSTKHEQLARMTYIHNIYNIYDIEVLAARFPASNGTVLPVANFFSKFLLIAILTIRETTIFNLMFICSRDFRLKLLLFQSFIAPNLKKISF